ncbi:MAG: methylmalonyl-CoA mutase family protein [Chloroflexi bacterium]|nr:methylmalonyl-CoA mutase family protein [Chloroflexota bacterium]
MTALESAAQTKALKRPPRFVIATPICDGHDVAATAITRLLRAQGAEAVYIGFNKSAQQIVKATVEEDASAIAISTYNGGHMSFIREVLKEQRRQGIADVPLFCGGGGTILATEVASLERLGVAKVYRPPLDLAEAVGDMLERAGRFKANARGEANAKGYRDLAQRLTAAEWGTQRRNGASPTSNGTSAKAVGDKPRVWGLGGRGGAGKSTLIDELAFRFLQSTKGNIAVLTVDPTLGDRLRMLYCYSPRVYLRSVHLGPEDALDQKLPSVLDVLRKETFDLILVESVGLGQNDLGVAPYVDASVYCMTPEYGTDVQLEKEALLHRAEVVVMNKRDYPQADVRSLRVKNQLTETQKLILTEAKLHGDPGVTALFELIAERSGLGSSSKKQRSTGTEDSPVPPSRRGYLGGVVDTHEAYYQEMEREISEASSDSAKANDYQQRYGAIWSQYGFKGGPDLQAGDTEEEGVIYRTDDKGVRTPVARRTTTGIWVPVIGLPSEDISAPEIVRYLYKQNVPGDFPYTEGAYSYRRTDQNPIRMFAGLGLPETTNRRFHLLRERGGAPRLSTAFDSLTLYGMDSDEPGALAKVGEGGVAVDTIDDMLALYDGFNLEETSVSMTMNGPAPTIMAMYLAAARRRGFDWKKLRGTIQTDILKEVQAQNEALIPLEPALRLIADMIDFTMKRVPLWYPISISGYHIGEAGANPIQELAFTLANGFTYVEVLRNRGLPIDEFAKRLSFFFTSGSELEFNVLGRVARRIWAVGMKRHYNVDGASVALKFHSQTSGRSLQDVEPLHNLTRVALQAEHALHNNTNSLHTNSYKETYSTPEEEDVLLAMGSQQIPLLESGDFRFTENLFQGGYGLSYLEDEVERAVHRIFREIDQQGGVIPAIENEYFRTVTQKEVQKEQRARNKGERTIVGVNYMESGYGEHPRGTLVHIPVADKRMQIARTRTFKRQHAGEAKVALNKLKDAAPNGGNVFEVMLDAVEVSTVGQITHALWEVWGRFRPSM